MSSIATASNDLVQNCLNSIAHQFYSVEKAICGLCSTDCKVYTLLILGRTLQAASLVCFSASIAFTVFTGPVSLAGMIPSIALGILGTYVAGNPREFNDLFYPIRPFVPGQPVGLINSGQNCWLNASLQLLANVPAYHARLRQIPAFAQFLDNYATEGRNYQKVARTIDSHAIRQILSHETGGQIEQGHLQTDAAQAFECLFEGPNALYTLEQQINGGLPTQQREPMIQIVPGLQTPRPAFQQLFNSYFDHLTDNGHRKQLFFPRSPDDLLIHVQRFYQYVDDNRNLQQGKILDAIDIPERIDVPNQFVRSNEAGQYEPDAFLIHYGSSLNSGHFVAYIKKGGTWWYCSDTAVYEVSAAEAFAAGKYCTICHCSQVS